MLNTNQLCNDESFALPVDRSCAAHKDEGAHSVFFEGGDLRLLKENEKFYILFESLAPQICPVVAVSKKGFLISYVDTSEAGLKPAGFDVLRSGDGILMKGWNANSITLVKTENKSRSEFTVTKYCFVSVGTLSFHEKTKMEFFIRKFTREIKLD